MTNIQNDIKQLLLSLGVSDVGFCKTDDGVGGLYNAVSIVVQLSDAIIDEIGDKPTHTYFNHYRSVNAFIDHCLLRVGLLLQQNGYKYITVASSQSINDEGWFYRGRYSHKKAAVLA
ncbi:MAG: epoxyqueuosine reductase, partial [Oscillospiraceae bacterium]|nr:epoxyqueuosine reductase [Oscillospiraceae bacterium]